MLKRLVTTSAISLAVAVSGYGGVLAVGGSTATNAPLALPCAPSLQDPQCLLGGLTCHQRCSSTVVVASLPGDPCSRNWGDPVEEICHL